MEAGQHSSARWVLGSGSRAELAHLQDEVVKSEKWKARHAMIGGDKASSTNTNTSTSKNSACFAPSRQRPFCTLRMECAHDTPQFDHLGE
ncbi:hypothetical protein Ct61P_00846 [Colletotrichum tofieldiae]|nr:hypothetical protein Ct61P_00846 [Colletotrichum tofieldiae]